MALKILDRSVSSSIHCSVISTQPRQNSCPLWLAVEDWKRLKLHNCDELYWTSSLMSTAWCLLYGTQSTLSHPGVCVGRTSLINTLRVRAISLDGNKHKKPRAVHIGYLKTGNILSLVLASYMGYFYHER